MTAIGYAKLWDSFTYGNWHASYLNILLKVGVTSRRSSQFVSTQSILIWKPLNIKSSAINTGT
jgi:hypothetical protein